MCVHDDGIEVIEQPSPTVADAKLRRMQLVTMLRFKGCS